MRTKTSFILVIIFIMAAGAVFAESPRNQLQQMVEQLQKTPGDDALREQIIKLAQELKPAPVIPDEAERRMARGTAAFKGAKSVADYRDAAKEFEQATLAAPWYGDAYLNLGVAQDKAEDYEAALRSLKLALLASPNDKEIKALIYEVEYRSEKAHSPEAVAARQQAEEKKMIASLEGAVYVCPDVDSLGSINTLQYRVENGVLKSWGQIVKVGPVMRGVEHVGDVLTSPDAKLTGKITEVNGRRYEISPQLLISGDFRCPRK